MALRKPSPISSGILRSVLMSSLIGLAVAACSLPVTMVGASPPEPPKTYDPDFCADKRTIVANVAVIDQPLTLTRLGAMVPGGKMYALAHDVFPQNTTPADETYENSCVDAGNCTAGGVKLRSNQRPRPIVLRVNEGECLEINLTNLLSPTPDAGYCQTDSSKTCSTDNNCPKSGSQAGKCLLQPTTQAVSAHAQGMPWVHGPQDDGSYVGRNCNSQVYPQGASGPDGPVYCAADPGQTATYNLFAEHEGSYLLYSRGDDWTRIPNQGGDGGLIEEGLFGSVNIQPSGYEAALDYMKTHAKMKEMAGQAGEPEPGPPPLWEAEWYRSQVTEQDMCLAQPEDHYDYQAPSSDFPRGLCTTKEEFRDQLPVIHYQAVYPAGHPSAGLPILNMARQIADDQDDQYELIHSDLTALITGPDAGNFPTFAAPLQPPSLRPVYSYPDRDRPYREFTIIYHETYQVSQAFQYYFNTLPATQAAQDNFGINYGFGGLAPPLLANRMEIGAMGRCVDCKYEEFFLTSWALGDPSMVVDKLTTNCVNTTGVVSPSCQGSDPEYHATKNLYPDDPSNVYHSYMMDNTRFRILHAGPDLHHLHHQHAHQWLGTPNSPNGDYLDSQSIGPGSSFTLEMVYWGSGNVNQTVGDSIFHCHFYPHFASGMWSLWRVHDVFERGSVIEADGTVKYDPENGNRAYPDAEIPTGTPIPAVVPTPTQAMAPLPAPVRLLETASGEPDSKSIEIELIGPDGQRTGVWVAAGDAVPPSAAVPTTETPWYGVGEWRNPGYPFFIPGIAGSRAPHPPLDFAWACSESGSICNPYPGVGICDNNSRQECYEDGDCDGGTCGNYEREPVPCGAGEGTCQPLSGGLPRHVVTGGEARFLDPTSVAGGATPFVPFANSDFSKQYTELTADELPEGGTFVEKIAMSTHAQRLHDTQLPSGCTGLEMAGPCADVGICDDNRAVCAQGASVGDPAGKEECANPFTADCVDGAVNFVLNGLYPRQGAPYADPCISFDRLGGRNMGGLTRQYLATDIQLDAIFDKEGWHFPQQRMITLWGDAQDTINRLKPPEPLFMRVNSYDCMAYTLANLVPNVYELDDFQVRTPTDVIGQHIHLVKFDVTSSDGSSNGWNYEDGTFGPNEVTERINALNKVSGLQRFPGSTTPATLTARDIRFFGPGPGAQPTNPNTGEWLGAQATVQRWYNDPLFNNIEVCSTNLDILCTIGEDAPYFKAELGGMGCPKFGTCLPSAGFCSDNGARCAEDRKEQCGDPILAECHPTHDRTIRTVFTHDHFGPSTHQQAGLYAGVVAEPQGSAWRHNETGEILGGWNEATQKPFPAA